MGDKLKEEIAARRGWGQGEGGAGGSAGMIPQGAEMKAREEVDQAEGTKDLGQ